MKRQNATNKSEIQNPKAQISNQKSTIRNPKSEITDNPVLFVGAGPGDPELITVKGQKALMEADLVIYAGSLVPEALLVWTRSDTRILSSASMHLEEIIAEIQSAHAEGQRVVRLHTGDPSLYGAIYEQISELSKQGIPYKVIPGVTAAFAAAATLGIEYTLPQVSQTLILTRMAGRTPVPEKENLASLAAHQTSMAIYLSMSAVDEVSEILCEAYGENSTCAVVYRASQPEEKTILTPLKQLAARVAAEKITKTALIIVGKVLSVKPDDIGHKSKLYDKNFKHECRS
ncbi:MAG: precorrin-4 C(11)-methyltransferase [Desulfobacteraceae bacterium]|nr:precorrin-4 C(11)-methyltransferase [Desulfobacteraceae bacterium]